MSQQPVQTVSGKLILLIKSRLLAGAADHRRHGDGLLHPAAADDGGATAQPHAARHRQHAEGAVAAHRLPCQRNRCRLARQAAGPGHRAQAGDRASSRRITICCSSRPAPIRTSPARFDPKSIESVLFAKPFHLDYFSVGLIANGERLISAFESAARHGNAAATRAAASASISTLPSPMRRCRAMPRLANASAPMPTSGRTSSSIFTARCSTPPSASSCWWRFSSSGRCRTPSCARRMS